MCPADRFFEIAHELRQTIEKGLKENALELALRGRPVDPFYMVGRMGGQSVVIRAEKGKVRMLVDGESSTSQKELVYPRRKREAVYRCIQELAAEVSTRAGKPVITPMAWRVAAKQWLLKNRLIRIQKAGKVSPNFCQKMDHN